MTHTSHTLAISGWAQPHDALRAVCGQRSLQLDYHACTHVEEVMTLLRTQKTTNFECCVGWSLGGVLLLYALTHKVITTKQLVLLSVPYQFVACDLFEHGMDRLTFDLFYHNYQTDAKRTAKRFASLIAHGDKHAERIVQQLPPYIHEDKQEIWLPWLEILHQQRTHHFNFENFPPTLILHGTDDRVVSFAQAQALHAHMPHAELVALEACGHAPHLHHPDFVQETISHHRAKHHLPEITL